MMKELPSWVQIPPAPPVRTRDKTETTQSKVVTYLLGMQRDGYRPSTIESHGKTLRFLARNSNLENPDQIKDFIADRKNSLGRKENIVDIYARYAKFHNIHFSEPRYARTDTLPFVPLQQELETLINDTRNLRHVALLRLLFETGMRVGEASQSRFKDYDFEKRAVRVLPEKGSRTRELRLSEKACSMLRDVYSKYPKGPLPAPRTARRYLERTRTFLARTKQ